jgi:hypothetical protein
MMREIGGRNDFVVRGAPSRFGRGFFSSISDTDSTGAFGAGAGAGTAAAAAAAAAARERAAGVGATSVLRGAAVGAVALAARALADFGLSGASAGTAGDFAALPAMVAGLRVVVLVVVRVGIGFF